MAVLLLLIIYLSFISLGLPDSLLGSVWPVMRTDLGAPLSAAGLVSMIVCGGTIVSSLFSSRLVGKFGTGRVTLLSVGMTAGALLGYSLAPSVLWLCVMAVPMGLGAGSVDAALNNFVALHYKASHMSWLHCFWGIGATSGPVIMSLFLMGKGGWKPGFLVISIIQFVLVAFLLISLPLWKKFEATEKNEDAVEQRTISNREAFRLPGVKGALLAFLCYCGAELMTGLWGSSFLVEIKGLEPGKAAGFISLYYGGITAGRFLSGFLTLKFDNKTLIRMGQGICLAGTLLLLLPLPSVVSLAGLLLVGLGCAPIYPCMLHETPVRFGKEVSQSVMGLQMATAYVGSTFLPPLLGAVAEKTSILVFPFFVLVCILIMIWASERVNQFMKQR